MPESDRIEEVTGLDNLEMCLPPAPGPLGRAWAGLWPKLAAFGFFMAAWEAAAWAKGKEHVLPGPVKVVPKFFAMVTDGTLIDATRTTIGRAVFGFTIALAIF